MKVYVAGKWEDRKHCKTIMQSLTIAGHEITVDWTDHKYEDEAYPKQYCQDDVRGVTDCQVFVGVFEGDYNYRGALVEFGIAIGQGKPCIFLGHAQDNCIFSNHPLVKVVENEVKLLEIIGGICVS